jgi:hypothetical protein
MSNPVADLERWRDHGATYRVLELRDERAVVQLCTCYGEPVELLESSEPELIAYLRGRPEAGGLAG